MTFFAFPWRELLAQSPQGESWAELTLKSAGFPPTVEGAAQYLQSLKPSENATELTKSLVLRLGNEQFTVRESAMLQLGTLLEADMVLLREHQNSPDAEIRWRIGKLLGTREFRDTSLLSASLSMLESSTRPDLRELAWNGSILADDRVCLANLSRYLHHAYKNDPHSVLKKAIEGETLSRVTAIETLRLMLPPKEAAESVRPLLQDPHPLVVLGVSRILADVGDRECLRALATIVANEDRDIAASAVWLLESLSGVTATPKAGDTRAPAETARFWRAWCDAEGRSAPLHFPVGRSHIARGSLAGGMLYSTGSTGLIVLTNRAGEKIWQYEMPAWSVEKLRNGNVLIASFDKAEVREVSLDNQVIWRWSRPGARPIRAKPLPNGNVLIADYDGKSIWEINQSQQEVWKVVLENENCFDAERLENGNTLVATPTSLIEYRPNLEKVKTWNIPGRINSVQVLSTGNFLVANHQLNQVAELNRNGEVVWKFDERGASEAFQTDDGHYLITSDQRCIELSPDRTRTRVLHSATYGSARR